MSEVKVYGRVTQGCPEWVKVGLVLGDKSELEGTGSSPDERDATTSLAHVYTGAARVMTERRRSSGHPRPHIGLQSRYKGTVVGPHSTRRAGFTNGYRLPVRVA